MDKSISRTISEFALNLKYEDLPKNVVDEVKRFGEALKKIAG